MSEANAGDATIPQEVLQRIRQIEIQTRRLVNDLFLGQYHAVFRGQGIEFSEVREYQFGDDQRAIDWNVTARMGAPYIKKFQEERELNVVLAADVSASSAFGTAGRSKAQMAAEAGAVLALSAIRNNDRVGLLSFTDRIETYIEPRKGGQHTLRIIRELLYPTASGRRTDLGLAAETLGRVLKRRSLVFLMSDFAAQGFEAALRFTARKHDVVAITITDPREIELPAMGIVELEDAETGEILLLDSDSDGVRRRYNEIALTRAGARSRLLRGMGIDEIALRTDGDFVEPLMAFFRSRASRN